MYAEKRHAEAARIRGKYPERIPGGTHQEPSGSIYEYRMHFEKDKALARRFQPVLINEPSQLEKHQRADQELKKRVLKLVFSLQEARSQTWKLQRGVSA
ncbi:uncharacterized protein LOC131232899 isoform X2 [Magnolia sinica]|uniref:uncharacterized protein LOC131232899 isoform X2 n=1 Tax=Magnolia sinica TaxID=86752 RepID=UPI00265A4E0B|nr:uncharacterized protein LOC131232899 isoform X2 [Magnolia sinica]